MTNAEEWASDVVHLAQLYIGNDQWIDKRDVTRHVAMAVEKIQADAIEWARQLYQNWNQADGNLIESYNRLLSEKVEALLNKKHEI